MRRMRSTPRSARTIGLVLAGLVALVPACSGDGDDGAAGGSAGAGGSAVTVPSRAPVLPTGGGPILDAPRLVAVLHAGHPDAAALTSFTQWVAGSRWLLAVGGEYGVKTPTFTTAVTVADTPPMQIEDGDVAAFLTAKIASGAVPAPDASGQTVYVVFYPPGVTVNHEGMIGCKTTFSHHGGVMGPSGRFAYVAVPSCSSAFEGRSALASTQVFASRALVGALTDPFPLDAPAYQLGDARSPWTSLGSEVSDLCPWDLHDEDGWVVSRIWSNAAAARDREPCRPAPDDEVFSVETEPATTRTGKRGETLTWTLRGFTTTPRADWTIAIVPSNGNVFVQTLLDQSTMNAGLTATVSLTIPKDVAADSYTSFLVASSDGARTHYWPAAVVIP